MPDLESMLVDRISNAVMEAIKPALAQRRLLTEPAAMEILGVSSPNTMRKMRQDGLPAYQPTGRQYYYFSDDLEAYVRRKGRAV